jgi:uncharacterized membrane protein YczE
MNIWIYVISTLDGVSQVSMGTSIAMWVFTILSQFIMFMINDTTNKEFSAGFRIKLAITSVGLACLLSFMSMLAPNQSELRKAKETYQTIMRLRIETVINVIQAVFCILKWLQIIDWGWGWVLTPLWAGWVYMTVVVSLIRLRDRMAYKRHQKLVETVHDEAMKQNPDEHWTRDKDQLHWDETADQAEQQEREGE